MNRKKIYVLIIVLLGLGVIFFAPKFKNTSNDGVPKSPYTSIFGREYVYLENGEPTDMTITISNNAFSGFGGLNRYSTNYIINADGSIFVKQIGGAIVAGPRDRMEKESKYFRLLNDVNRIEIKDGGLVLRTKGNSELVFVEKRNK